MGRPSTIETRVLGSAAETRDRRPAGRLSAWLGAAAVAALVGASALAQVAPEPPAPPAAPVAEREQIQIDAKFVEVPAGAFPAAEGAALNSEQAAELMRKLQAAKGVDFLSAPRVVTRSGQRATIQIGKDYLLPPGSTPKTKFVGLSLAATPTRDGGTIQLAVKTEIVSVEAAAVPDQPSLFRERETETEIKVRVGESVILTKLPADKSGREIYVVLMATTLPPGPAR